MVVKFFKNFIYVSIPTLIIIFLILELFFRFIIKSNEFPMHYYDKKDNVYKFDTNYQRKGEWAIGKFCNERGDWNINDQGWNDNYNFDKNHIDSNKKTIAIYGDSQIEGFIAGLDSNLTQLLRNYSKNEYNILRFGKSDAPYSQYLQMHRYAKKYWKIDIAIFSIMHNDFRPSIAFLEKKPHFLQFAEKNGNIFEIKPEAPNEGFIYSSIVKANYYSAFLRYLFYNIKITKSLAHSDLFLNLQSKKTNKNKFNANINVSEANKEKELYAKYFDYFIKKTLNENQSTKLIFLMDGPRFDIQNNRKLDKDILSLNFMFKEICEQNQVVGLDLTEPFILEYKKNKIPLLWKEDGHWTREANDVAAKEINTILDSFKNDSIPILR